jgi:hypothetical protein
LTQFFVDKIKVSQQEWRQPFDLPSSSTSELSFTFYLGPRIKPISLIEQKGIKSSLFDDFGTPPIYRQVRTKWKTPARKHKFDQMKQSFE